MTRYEYMIADLHSVGGKTTVDRLNELGADGWLIIDTDRDTDAHIRAVLVREIPDEEKDNGRKAKASAG